MESVRHPAVAGRFYPGDRAALLDELETYLSPASGAKPALGCVVPHAGYIYSGPVAGAVYANLEVPPCCVVLCPNHTGRGKPLAIMGRGLWQTPLGSVAIDSALADRLKVELPLLTEDSEAHRGEHAIEVQLPFLQKRQSHFRFVPIVLGTGNFWKNWARSWLKS
jgi:AmmeMemoRadiSam system protein B